MLKNYFKIALRNLFKNRLYFLINVGGLGVAIAISIVGYVNYQFSRSFDTFHENADNIYLVNSFSFFNNNRQIRSTVPTPLAPNVKESIPGIENYARIARKGGTFRYKDKVFIEKFYFMDEKFFDVFTFKTVLGTKDALKDKSSIIITDEVATKYFGEENPVGKQVVIYPGGEKEYAFLIGGVIKKPADNSSLQISVCIPYERQEDLLGYNLDSWSDWTSALFLQLNNHTSISLVEENLNKYIDNTNEANPNRQINGFYLTPLQQLAFVSRDIRGYLFNYGMHPAAILAPSVTALLVLLLACFNFVNTAVAFASRRLKEIGIRKVIGGNRGQLIRQFLGENLLLCFFALMLGILLASVFVPAYDSLWPNLSLSLNYWENLGLVSFIIGLLFFTAIAAGAYPAFYISRFNPVNIFRGKQKLGGTNPLIRVLLTFQFAISMTTIIGSIILIQNSEFIRDFDLGFNKEDVLIIPIRNGDDYTLIRNNIENNPGIVSVGGSQHLMGIYWVGQEIESEQNKTIINLFEIGENYFETAGFKLIAGRSFDKNLKTDIEQSIIINETLMNELGWTSAINKYIKFRSSDAEKEYLVIGVVKDFYYNGVWQKIGPTALRYTSPESYRYLSVKFDPEELKTVSTDLENTWKQLFPNIAYGGFFASEILAGASQITNSIRLVFMYIAIMVIITSGMGLFALVALNISKRTKELGIRKILGATALNISGLISREFVLLLLIGSLLAFVMGYFLVESLLSSIWVYHVEIGVLPFIISGVLMFVIAMLTVSSQVLSAANSNPIDSIRVE